MKLRIASDIHTEFMHYDIERIEELSKEILPVMDDEINTALILAGDIGSNHKIDILVRFLEVVCPRFDTVLYMPGNHEYYGGQLEKTDELISRLTKHIPNLLFGNDARQYKGRWIHCYTLWTDFNDGNPMSMQSAYDCMHDYRVCKNKDGKTLMPQDTLKVHRRQLAILKETISEGDIVVTHHLPSFQSVDTRYRSSALNPAYASNLEKFILLKKPALWIHGHTHASNDYHIGATRVVCNPRGYVHEINPKYNPTLVIEV